MAYYFESRVRYSEIGENKQLTMTGLLNYFQDCTTFHSENVGRGMEVLEAIRHVWVLASWQICVNRYPKLGEHIVVGTWPYEFKGFYGSRNFQMKTSDGEILAYANSLWTFLNLETGMPARILPEELAAYPPEDRLDMDYAPRKIRMPEHIVQGQAFTVKPHHLDTNHHVNNGQYVSMARDCFREDFVIRQLRVEYKRQALLGDLIVPCLAREEDRYVVSLDNQAGQPYAIVEFTVKNPKSPDRVRERK